MKPAEVSRGTHGARGAPPTSNAARTPEGMLSGRARWELTPQDKGTRLTTTFDYALAGGAFGRIADALPKLSKRVSTTSKRWSNGRRVPSGWRRTPRALCRFRALAAGAHIPGLSDLLLPERALTHRPVKVPRSQAATRREHRLRAVMERRALRERDGVRLGPSGSAPARSRRGVTEA